MREVYLWAGGFADVREAEDILIRCQRGEWAVNVAQLRGEAQKTAETIRMTLTRALQFMGIPELARCVVPARGGIDFTQFLRAGGTLYLIADGEGPGEDAPLAALFACLTSELRWHAVQMGSRLPGARLDPPLLMALDKVTQICPVPVDKWLADSGGKGIQIITVAHGLAQLRERWGRDGAQIILDTSGVRMLLPGVDDTDTLDAFSKLCGEVALHDRARRRRRLEQGPRADHGRGDDPPDALECARQARAGAARWPVPADRPAADGVGRQRVQAGHARRAPSRGTARDRARRDHPGAPAGTPVRPRACPGGPGSRPEACHCRR
jgi:type IV secretion system protein VirD4